MLTEAFSSRNYRHLTPLSLLLLRRTPKKGFSEREEENFRPVKRPVSRLSRPPAATPPRVHAHNSRVRAHNPPFAAHCPSIIAHRSSPGDVRQPYCYHHCSPCTVCINRNSIPSHPSDRLGHPITWLRSFVISRSTTSPPYARLSNLTINVTPSITSSFVPETSSSSK